MENQLEQLERLARLRDRGALTPEEFLAEKARLLGTSDVQTPVQQAAGEANTPQPPSASPRRHRVPMIAASVVAVAALGGGAAFYSLRQPSIPAQAVQSQPMPQPEVAIASPPLVPAPPEPSQLALEDDLRFSDPANCQASATTEALFNRILTPPNGDVANIASKTIRVGVDRIEVTPIMTKTAGDNEGERVFEGVANVLQPATWHGLRVRGISASLYAVPEAGSTYTRQIRFLDDPDTARAALNKLGFNIPRFPEYAKLHDDSCGGSMQVVAAAGGSALQCSWGC
jgi:hypothetical protein